MHIDYWHTNFHIPGLLSTSALNVMEATVWVKDYGLVSAMLVSPSQISYIDS